MIYYVSEEAWSQRPDFMRHLKDRTKIYDLFNKGPRGYPGQMAHQTHEQYLIRLEEVDRRNKFLDDVQAWLKLVFRNETMHHVTLEGLLLENVT